MAELDAKPKATRESLLHDLSAIIGGNSRTTLERLPTAELVYLSMRGDLQKRYAEPARGPVLLEWEMSAVARGDLALAEIELCQLLDWKKVRALDIGCGDGGFLIAMAKRGARANGLDLCEFNIMGATYRARAWDLPVAALVASASALPYRPDSFDVVTCGDVIEHVPQPLVTLREIHRVLRPGGLLWIAGPTRYLLANVRRDPHYGYFGVSLLSRRAAGWYLSRVRRAFPKPEHYAVERLPRYGGMVATLRSMGFEILAGEYRPLTALRNPDRMESHRKKRVVRMLAAIGLRGPLTWLYRMAAELIWPIRLVCRKPQA